jgi:hypothetical protein
VIVDKEEEVSHKDIERGRESKKGGEKAKRGRESKRYDVGKGSIKIEHTSRGSKLMNHLLHLYVH